MKIIRQSSLGNVQVFSFILFITTILCTIICNLFFNIDYCAVERVYEDEKSSKFLHHLHLLISFGCVLLIALQFVFWNPLKLNSKRSGNRFVFNDRSVFLILFTFLWYGSTYCLCYLLKRILDDKTCNRTHNSVSGHFLFHSFYLITIPYWFLTVGRLHNKQNKELENNNNNKTSSSSNSGRSNNNNNNNRSPTLQQQQQQQQQQKKSQTRKEDNIPMMEARHELKLIKRLFTENATTILIILTYGIYIYSSWINLEKTWVFGFHSLRQILYGLILSFLSLYVLLFVTSKNNNLDKKSSCFKLVLSLATSWIISILLLNYFGVRLPFKLMERILFFICFLFLIYFSIYRSQNASERQQVQQKKNK